MAGLAHFFDNDVAGSMHGLRKYGLTAARAPGRPRNGTARHDRRPRARQPGGVRRNAGDRDATGGDQPRRRQGDVQHDAKPVRRPAACARSANGGVIGIGYWDAAVCKATPAATAAAIKHVRDLVGVQYVGLGSDFDGGTTTGIDTAELGAVTQALLDAGFSDAEIAAVMGGNVIRVLRAGTLSQ
jgi:membrane dipeptidase